MCEYTRNFVHDLSMCTHIHTHTQSFNASVNKCGCTCICKRGRAHTNKHTHRFQRGGIHVWIYMRMYTHARTRTHTHSHTHTGFNAGVYKCGYATTPEAHQVHLLKRHHTVILCRKCTRALTSQNFLQRVWVCYVSVCT